MSSRKSLAQQIAELNDPSPLLDPEDEFEGDTRAKLLARSEQDDGGVDSGSLGTGRIRRQAALSLEEVDVRYEGRKTSRRNLVDGSDSESGSDSENDVDEGNAELESFKKLMQQPTGGKESLGAYDDDDGVDDDGVDDEEDADSLEEDAGAGSDSLDKDIDSGKIRDQIKISNQEEEGDSDTANVSDHSGQDVGEDGSGGSENVEGEEQSGEEVTHDDGGSDAESDIEVVTKVNLGEEIEKGLAAKNQQGLWDNFLEARIKLQKGLQLSNQLPQYRTHHNYIAMEGQEGLLQDASAGRQKLKKLLKGLLKLQDELLLQNNETKHIVTGEQAKTAGSDEEIPSDDEEITSDDDQPLGRSKSKPSEDGKRKIDLTNPGEEITKRHKRFEEYRDTVIHSWYDKTRLASGKLSSKSFTAMEKSPVDQVQQIMMDKARLIHRTQLKRSTYRVIGQSEKAKKDTPPEAIDDRVPEVLPVRSSTLDDVDPEIFDDDDFYHQLLKELIEKKAADTTDPAQLTRQWLAVQKLRSKVKKVVDTRASKGRKLRYNIHQKMVSFMAPKDESTMTDEARNELFSSLFGNTKPEAVR